MAKIPLEELSKILGMRKGDIVKLVYAPGSTLRYEEIDGIKFFDYDAVVKTITKGRWKK